MPAATRREIVERFRHYTLTEPNDVELPDEPAMPIEELGAPVDALQCRTCALVTVSKDKLRQHCKKDHQQAWTGEKSSLYKTVKVQSFFRTAGMQKYFVVETDDAGNPENANVEVAVQEELAAYSLTQQQIQEELQILEAAAKTDKTGWFKRTGWLEFFKGRNLKHLVHQARAPDRGEDKMKLAAELTERLVERSVRGLATLPHELRRWLRSAKLSEADTRPLARLQNPESQARYASYMVKFVCFYLRVLADGEQRIIRVREGRFDCDSEETASSEEGSEEDSEDGEDGEESEDESNAPRPPRRSRRPTPTRAKVSRDKMKDARELFTWTVEQKACAIRLWDALDGSERVTQMDALLKSIGSFIFTKYHPEALSTGLMQFLAVLGIDPDTGRLRTAKQYSYILAGMVYCVRVIGAEKLLPGGQRNTQTEQDRDHFIEMRHKYLADGTFTPFNAPLLAYLLPTTTRFKLL